MGHESIEGVLGSAVATFAVILPAYLVILLVLGILKIPSRTPMYRRCFGD